MRPCPLLVMCCCTLVSGVFPARRLIEVFLYAAVIVELGQARVVAVREMSRAIFPGRRPLQRITDHTIPTTTTAV